MYVITLALYVIKTAVICPISTHLGTIIHQLQNLDESELCSVSSSINYILTLVDSIGMVVEQRVVPMDSCIDGFCSTNIMAIGNCHRVEVWATSPFGNSSSAVDYSGKSM